MAYVTPVTVGRFIFSVLSLAMATIVIYTCSTDGSPFRMEILTPWMGATLIDFYINVAVLSTWVFYKEDTWRASIGWTIGFIGLGSIMTSLYVAIELFKLKASDPFYLIFLNKRHARLLSHEVLNSGSPSTS